VPAHREEFSSCNYISCFLCMGVFLFYFSNSVVSFQFSLKVRRIGLGQHGGAKSSCGDEQQSASLPNVVDVTDN